MASPYWSVGQTEAPEINMGLGTPTTKISFDVAEGTFMSVDVSPDGDTLVFDLLGDIYSLPITGGLATPITEGRAWDTAPRYSSDGDAVYFVSDRVSFRNIWRLDLSDKSLVPLTTATADVLGTPNRTADGLSLLAGVGDAARMNAEVFLNSISTKNGAMKPILQPDTPAFDWSELQVLRPYVRVFSAVQAADGQLYYSQASFDERLGRRVARIYTMRENSKPSPVTQLSAGYSEYKPQLSSDGRLLAYFRQFSDRRTEVRLLDRTTGRDVALLDLGDADDAAYGASQDMFPNYSFTPDNQQIVFWHGGKINQLSIAGRVSEIIPFQVAVSREVSERVKPNNDSSPEGNLARVIRWPSVSVDGRRMTFAAFGYVWVMDMRTNQVERLTTSDDLEYMPAISEDGHRVAYVSYAGSSGKYGPGRLMIANTDGTQVRELLARNNTSYILPNWSNDKARIAVIQEVSEPNGTVAHFGWAEVATGRFYPVSPAPASDEYLAGHTYSRFVGFDGAGQELLFSYPESRTKIVLASAGLYGGPLQVVATGNSDVGGIVAAPDLRHLALTRRDGSIWLLPYDHAERGSMVSTSAPAARRLGASGGYYLRWSGDSFLTYGFGRDVYRYASGARELQSAHVEVASFDRCTERLVALTGARLLTMEGVADDSITDRGTVVIKGSTITAVGPAAEIAVPPNALVVDVSGKTIMPGFIDSHYHRIGGSGGAVGLSGLKLPNASFDDKTAIGYGITGAWEPGGPWDDGVPATADLQRAGRIMGPQWSYSAMGSVGSPWDYVETYDQALAAVDSHKTLGVVVLKEYNTPTRRQRQWLYEAAKTRGLGIVSHVESLDGMMTRVVDGYTGGEHATIPIPFYDDVHQLLRRTGFVWTPNISIESGAIGGARDADGFYWRAFQEEGPAKLDKLKALVSPDRYSLIDLAVPSVPFTLHRMSRVAAQAADAAQGGVHIGVSGHSMPGANFHKEMWYLWRGGMPAHSVLRAATLGNAEKLGISEDVGTLAIGKIANILVLDENPLADMLNTMSIRYTIQQGAVYDSDTVIALRPEEMEGFIPQSGDRRASSVGTMPQRCTMKAATGVPPYGN